MSLYKCLKRISETPLLSQEKELELVRQIKLGNPDAKNQLVESNLRLVVYVARKYKRYFRAIFQRKIHLEDLIGVGTIGLIGAAEGYTPGKSKFSTYAFKAINRRINQDVIEHLNIVKVPASVGRILSEFYSIEGKLWQEMSRKPTLHEVVDRIDSISDKILTMAVWAFRPSQSLDWDLDQAQNSPAWEFDDLEWLRECLKDLSCREKEVIIARMGINKQDRMTLGGVGKLLKITRERVRQLEAKAIRKLTEFATQRLGASPDVECKMLS